MIFPDFTLLFNDILQNPAKSLAIIGNLILIESLLSVDNAAVLATIVMDLPEHQRKRALKYGILGAYLFRGLALIFASVLISVWWLKPLGGLYLIYISLDWLIKKMKNKNDEESADESPDKESSWLYKNSIGLLGQFWATVAIVEVMDLAFSIDNVFAAVAFSDNLLLITLGVFIGILAMRFIAQWFVRLMQIFPFLETAAFIVIAILGIKLSLSLFEHFYPATAFAQFLGSHTMEILVSAITVLLFVIPVVTSYLVGFPTRKK
ncbi:MULTISPECIES: TerC family protein [unclassified Chryseobacterium]|uniref:TerC family protein n=1 Tax=unclassified Chryseobacterium TaxID=2593645 RepID=UPI001AE43C36|nr:MULTISPECIES: TerC family protein [unclassified Chryseobacterium]MBP1167170.1 YkoY family integral membrane protein [Chryseobacterium sp. PvR013]MDR4893450.1 TerC family protein [Chryseobacterium sp. CFS7]